MEAMGDPAWWVREGKQGRGYHTLVTASDEAFGLQMTDTYFRQWETSSAAEQEDDDTTVSSSVTKERKTGGREKGFKGTAGSTEAADSYKQSKKFVAEEARKLKYRDQWDKCLAAWIEKGMEDIESGNWNSEISDPSVLAAVNEPDPIHRNMGCMSSWKAPPCGAATNEKMVTELE